MSNVLVQELTEQNAKLKNRLALTCKENSSLTSEVSALKQKLIELAKTPYDKESVLGQLYDPEKAAGWFKNGSKNGAKEQLQKLCDGLQKEYVEYKTRHTHSDEEVTSILKQLESAQSKSSELAEMLQKQSSSAGGENDTADIRTLKKQLEDAKRENSRLQKEVQMSGTSSTSSKGMSSSSGVEGQLKLLQGENLALQQELEAVKETLEAEEGMHKMKARESEEMSRRLEVLRTQHREEIAALKREAQKNSAASKGGCDQCALREQELEELQQHLTAVQEELNHTRIQITETASATDKKVAALEARLMETQTQLSEKTSSLAHSVPLADHEALQMDHRKLTHDITLLKSRISHLESVKRGEEGDAPEDEEILSVLARNKEHISVLEFEKEQLTDQLKKVEQQFNDMERSRAEEQRKVTEDKQRVSFLLKKCANLGADARKLESEKDNLSSNLVSTQAELQRYQRQVETIPDLQKKIEDLSSDKQRLEDRLEATAEIEEQLVKAKETIAYMELAQSRTISLTQYAELQTQKQKLEHTMGPLQKQLEEAQKELEQLRSEKSAREAKASIEEDSEENLREELEGLKENEKILREKLSHYKEENQRLTTLNTSLDTQMTGMQSGIREMAMHMEKERTLAKEAAEKAAEKEVQKLREELERAKSTIAGIQATEGQFVSEGLYLSAVEEKQELLDEVQRKTLEAEKMKSEILIYRQTIDELETENDEHVHNLESLQSQVEELRASNEQRQVENEKQLVDTQEELLELRDAVQKAEEQLAVNEQRIEELEAKNANLQKAYDQKAHSEMAMSEQLATLKKAKPAAVAAGAAAAAPAASGTSTPVPKKKVKKVKKKKTLAEQLSDGGEEDVLGAANTSNASKVNNASPGVSIMALHDFDNTAAEQGGGAELERLQEENLTLRRTVEHLREDLERLQGGAGGSVGRENSPGTAAADGELARLRKEVREVTATAEKLKRERDDAKAELKRSKALNNKGRSEKEKELEKELHHLQAELRVVSEQLLPTKEKLSEYMGMADRIGITYPFCEEHERKLARKMRSIKKHSIV